MRSALTLLFFALGTCGGFGAPLTNSLDREEYDVYHDFFSSWGAKRLVIFNTTSALPHWENTPAIYLPDGLNKETLLQRFSKVGGADSILDFFEKNKHEAIITNCFQMSIPINLVSTNDLSWVIWGDPFQNQDFEKKYPGASWFRSISRVGFNKKKTEAFLYWESVSYIGRLCLLKKQGGHWKVVEEKEAWYY